MRIVELFEQQSEEGPCQDCYRSGNPIEDTRLTTTIERLGHSTITVTVDSDGSCALDLSVSRRRA